VTLRTRIVGVVVVVVAVVVVGVGLTLYRVTEASLVDEIDDDLVGRAELVTADRSRARPGVRLDRLRALSESGDLDSGRRFDPFVTLVGFDALARVVDENGVVRAVLDTEFDASTDAGLLADARQGPVLHDGTDDNGRLRVVTAALPERGFVQLARPLDEVDTVLGRLLWRTFVIGLLAIGGAGVVAWLLAGRTVRPIRELTAATEHVAATGDLERGVTTESTGDEVDRLAASFTAMLDALSASRHQQRRLVMDASHELRTPLTSLRTNIDVLRRGHTMSDESRAALLEDLDAEVRELADLMAELIDLATDLPAEEEAAPISLAELVEPVVERVRRRTGREIVVQTGRPAVLVARPEAMTRAIRNLVDNAAKFSPAGTSIRVEVGGGRVVVHDRGPGIPVDEREAVFDRFHRTESSRSLPGSGLGLAIVRQVIEAHGGEVFVETSPDGGAAVGFRLPTVDG
jgi:two-component system, OmpR family, sensor histidine kinase MprB